MYYEEEIINGALSYRSHPEGAWIEFTPSELTRRVLEARISFSAPVGAS